MHEDRPCPRCYRGSISRDTYQFADGPCNRPDCGWPSLLGGRRRHFTDDAWVLHTDHQGRYWWGPKEK